MAKYFEFKVDEVMKTRYGNNDAIALVIIDLESGEHKAVASANVPQYPLLPDHVIIKNYGENEGVLEELISMEVISEPIDTFQQGFAVLYVCKLLKTFNNESDNRKRRT